MTNVPSHGLICDYFVDYSKFPPELKPWTAKVPGFSYNKNIPFFQMLVPTVDTVRYSFLMDLCIDVQRSVLFTGMCSTRPRCLSVPVPRAGVSRAQLCSCSCHLWINFIVRCGPMLDKGL